MDIDDVHDIWRYYYIDDYGKYGKEYRFSSEAELCNFVIDKVKNDYVQFVKSKQNNIEKNKIKTPSVIYLCFYLLFN